MRLPVAARCAIALLAVALPTGPLAAQAGGPAPVVEKVDPPSWWLHSTVNPVRVLIRGRHLGGAALACPRLECRNVAVNAAGTYVFADVHIPGGVAPGRYPLTVRTARGTADATFEITPALERDGRFQGFDRHDVMYLLMPDRFANGDPTNDDPAESRGLLDRRKPRFYHGGDLRGVRQQLPYLKSLGITALWMNPIFDNNDRLNFKEKYDDQPMADYHGYGAIDFYGVEEHFGDLAEFRALVADAHRLGIKVIADMVANHTSWYHPWVTDAPTPTWFHGTAERHPNNTWQTWAIADPHASREVTRETMDGWFLDFLPDLDQDDPEVARYIMQNTLWWVAMSGMDGIRQDTWPYVPRTFWKPWMEAIKREFPSLRVVGEVLDGDAAILAFHQGGQVQWDGIDVGVDALFDFPLFFPMRNAFAQGGNLDQVAHALARDRLYVDPSSMVTLNGLHDVGRFMGEPGATLAGLKLAYTFQFTMRGTPLVYYGDEIGMAGGGDPENRRDFPGGWPDDPRNAFSAAGRTPAEQDVWAHLQRLARIRAEREDLRGDSTENLVVARQLWVYRRGNTVVALNNDTTAVTARIPVGALEADLLGLCGTPAVQGAVVAVRVPPRTGCILPIVARRVPGPALGVVGTRLTIPAFPSRFVDARQVEVWLPPGYETSQARYPVLYVHDGQNIFDPATAFGGADWGVDEWMTRLIGDGTVAPAIVVAVWNTPKRYQEYMGAKAIPRDTIFSTGAGRPPATGRPISDEYLRFLVEELKPYVDRTYRTRAGRDDTALMGSSMGGIISLYAMAEYPTVFGRVAALSTHWPAGDGAMLDYLARRLPAPDGRRVYLDRGTTTLDATYPAYQARADSLFRAKGYRDGSSLMTRVFDGAAHDERAWRTRLDEPLRFLLGPPARP